MPGKKVTQLKKRDGRITTFAVDKITTAIFKALRAAGQEDRPLAEKLGALVIKALDKKYDGHTIPSVEQVQDMVEATLIKAGLVEVAKSYILYRDQHAKIRDINKFINSDDLIDQYLNKLDWRVKENSNMAYSLQGLNNHVASTVSAHYWLNSIYAPEVRSAHIDAELHVHDLQLLAAYCCGWDLKDLLVYGFTGVDGKVQSKAPKHFKSALGMIVNFLYTLQGEANGAQAFSSFDTYLAPFIRHDQLDYKRVKQGMQEFLFNMNIPTRVGFQCMSEDTEILGQYGWQKYNQVKKGDTIATFNVERGVIEYLPVKKVFAKKYKGKMFNLKNRISDQLISPEHRVVRKRFGADGYVLEPIEKIINFKSPFMVPVGSQGSIYGGADLSENIIKLLAWIIAEGSLDKNGRGDGRISIYQSKIKSQENYQDIISLCQELELKFSERTQKGLGAECHVVRFDAESTEKILKLFNSNKSRGIKFIPKNILDADVETARIFLETYIRGNGHDDCKITTTSSKIKDGLMQVIVNAGYGATVLIRKPDNHLSKKDRYVIRLIKHTDTCINRVAEINYEGVIWCPNTDNETVIARRNGKIFITGNTPFTNITMDLKPSGELAEDFVIIGGEVRKERYKDFQPEMDMINRAFAEVCLEGDAKGRVFTFPIPTYNITKDLDWDNPVLEPVWEMTAKYGIPYFSNFVNSDMSPDDARSMCCRLRLDNRELKKRGGGLFGANPLTGSIGVVTINLPRIGYLAKDKADYFKRLDRLMLIARESLETKREVIEQFTNKGLYPYSRFYLGKVKEQFGEYWKNHFNTIGILGMNESLVNFINKDLTTQEGQQLAAEILDYMRDTLMTYQNETNHLYNLEATPGEGTTYRFAKADKKRYADIIVANEKAYRDNGAAPYYTNSSQLPVGYTEDIFEALDIQDQLQTKYTGGTVLHGFIGEKMPSIQATKDLVKKIASNYHLPYYTITPTFSVCPLHGYLAGEHEYCPKCDEEIGYSEDFEAFERNKVEQAELFSH